LVPGLDVPVVVDVDDRAPAIGAEVPRLLPEVEESAVATCRLFTSTAGQVTLEQKKNTDVKSFVPLRFSLLSLSRLTKSPA
jgi:hypothetical protein